MMKPKFEIGDRVIYKPCKLCGSIINRFRTTDIYAVVLDEDDVVRHTHENELEFENLKLAFLTRLQELLATFDAKITGGGYEGYDDYIEVNIKGVEPFCIGEDSCGYGCIATAENVFDYDKD